MIKRLLFIFIVLLLIVNVRAQNSSNFSSDDFSVDNTKPVELISMAYPNPADTETKINYNLPKESKEAKIIIRSLLGLIVSEKKLDGTNGTATFQTNDLSGGIYLYSLILDGEIKVTRKLIIRH